MRLEENRVRKLTEPENVKIRRRRGSYALQKKQEERRIEGGNLWKGSQYRKSLTE